MEDKEPCYDIMLDDMDDEDRRGELFHAEQKGRYKNTYLQLVY